MSTLAPGTAAPLASSTVPWIVPEVICVCARTPVERATIARRQIPNTLPRKANEESKTFRMIFSSSFEIEVVNQNIKSNLLSVVQPDNSRA